MNESQKAIKSLVFWHKVFAICLIVVVILACIFGNVVLKQSSAVGHCMAVDDSEFVGCYNAAKQ